MADSELLEALAAVRAQNQRLQKQQASSVATSVDAYLGVGAGGEGGAYVAPVGGAAALGGGGAALNEEVRPAADWEALVCRAATYCVPLLVS